MRKILDTITALFGAIGFMFISIVIIISGFLLFKVYSAENFNPFEVVRKSLIVSLQTQDEARYVKLIEDENRFLTEKVVTLQTKVDNAILIEATWGEVFDNRVKAPAMGKIEVVKDGAKSAVEWSSDKSSKVIENVRHYYEEAVK